MLLFIVHLVSCCSASLFFPYSHLSENPFVAKVFITSKAMRTESNAKPLFLKNLDFYTLIVPQDQLPSRSPLFAFLYAAHPPFQKSWPLLPAITNVVFEIL